MKRDVIKLPSRNLSFYSLPKSGMLGYNSSVDDK